MKITVNKPDKILLHIKVNIEIEKIIYDTTVEVFIYTKDHNIAVGNIHLPIKTLSFEQSNVIREKIERGVSALSYSIDNLLDILDYKLFNEIVNFDSKK